MNYVLRPFEGNINPRVPQEQKIYLQATKDIEKLSHKLYLSVSNTKDIIYHFVSLANKYIWGRLALMVRTCADNKRIFRKID